MRLILVRHGETNWNVTAQYQGHAGIALNERGREQARRAGERLCRRGAIALYTSDIVRAWETAQIVGEMTGLLPQPMEDLREIDVGQWEGFTTDELHQRFPEHMREYQRNPARTVRLGGESYEQLQQRSLIALRHIQEAHQPNETVLAVSHGGTIRAMLCDILGLDLIHFGRMWLDNGSLTELRYGKHGWQLLRFNDAAHLETLLEAERADDGG